MSWHIWAFALASGTALIWLTKRLNSPSRLLCQAVVQKTKDQVAVVQKTRIEPLLGFDWSTTEPPVIRPFKPHYHMTMGIESITPSELVQIDWHYENRIQLRRQLLQTNRSQVLRALPGSEQAVTALYTWMMDYLPSRFVDVFAIPDDSLHEGRCLYNKVTGDQIPLRPSAGSEPESLLEALGRQVEEDFLILQPDKASGEFRLRAFIGCFPNGFDWADKLGQTLSEIHEPVPNYEQRLQKSMNRFLGRLEPEKFVQRHNWSISAKGDLFAVSNVHLYEGEKVSVENIDCTRAYLRCERQVVHRLSGSDAVVLAIHTYMYPLSAIRAEGNGPALAAAIDGLRTGNSPEMYFYKRAPNWSQSVKEYLLREEEDR
ncbi:hypothetical protein GQ53DRAFT_647066 [Thozetella sp. PMI_491]|nr:hypothetical protein GQ53DRAFT_647066 [Thozetella sp. PMI_491]